MTIWAQESVLRTCVCTRTVHLLHTFVLYKLYTFRRYRYIYILLHTCILSLKLCIYIVSIFLSYFVIAFKAQSSLHSSLLFTRLSSSFTHFVHHSHHHLDHYLFFQQCSCPPFINNFHHHGC